MIAYRFRYNKDVIFLRAKNNMISIEDNCTPWYKHLFNDSFLKKEKQYLEDMKCNTYFTLQQIYFIFHFAEQEIDWTMVEKVKI